MISFTKIKLYEKKQSKRYRIETYIHREIFLYRPSDQVEIYTKCCFEIDCHLFVLIFYNKKTAAYFYVGNTKKPSNQGAVRLRDERGSTGVIRRYRHKDITLSLPEGKTLRDIKWFSVWCDEFSVNFGDVSIPKNFDFPRPYKLAALKGVHAVSSDNIVVVDAQTILIPNFSYDGEAPGMFYSTLILHSR